MESTNPYAQLGLQDFAIFATPRERADFTRKMLLSLTAAVLSQVALLYVFFWFVSIESVAGLLTDFGQYAWFAIPALYFSYVVLTRQALSIGSQRPIQIGAYVLHILITTVAMAPVLALSTKIDPIMPIAVAYMAIAVFGSLAVLSQLLSLESLRRRGLLLIMFCAGVTAIAIGAYSGNFGFGAAVASVMILLTAAFVVGDIGNMLASYRTDQWLRSSMTLFTSAVLLVFVIISIVIFCW